MKPAVRSGLLPFLLVVASCDGTDPVGSGPEREPVASDAEIEAFGPAIADVRMRILPTGDNAGIMQQLDGSLGALDLALAERRGETAGRHVEEARASLAQCGDGCLVAPERSVIVLVLDHAAGLIGIDAGTP